MNVLSFQATGRVVPHTLRDVQESLVRLGHDVGVVDLVPVPRQLYAVALAEGILRMRPDVVFTIDVLGVLPSVFVAIGQAPPILAWFYDAPLELLKPPHEALRDRLHIFLWDRAYVEPVRARGFPHVYYQPFGTNTRRHAPSPGEPSYLYDVSFVGGHSPARAAFLHALGRHGIVIHVFGDERWAGEQGEHLVFGGYACNERDGPRIYAASRINLNITSEQLLTALPVRVFDVTACGGFLLTDERADASRLFTPGRELVVYEGPEDAARKIRHYLAHDQERCRIATCGMERARSDYAYDRLLPGMIETAWRDHTRAARMAPPPREETPRTMLAAWLFAMGAMRQGDCAFAQPYIERLMAHVPDSEMAMSALCLHGVLSAHPLRAEEALRGLVQRHAFWGRLEAPVRAALHGGAAFTAWDIPYARFFDVQCLAKAGILDGQIIQRINHATGGRVA